MSYFFYFSIYVEKCCDNPSAKKEPAINLSDYRPIAILPCLSKVLEMIMVEQIHEYLTENRLLSPFQSGFKPQHSCSTAIIKVTDDIRQAFDDGKVTILGTLDFQRRLRESTT